VYKHLLAFSVVQNPPMVDPIPDASPDIKKDTSISITIFSSYKFSHYFNLTYKNYHHYLLLLFPFIWHIITSIWNELYDFLICESYYFPYETFTSYQFFYHPLFISYSTIYLLTINLYIQILVLKFPNFHV
jgi:hypothetical protein